jgi:hypothetical protein
MGADPILQNHRLVFRSGVRVDSRAKRQVNQQAKRRRIGLLPHPPAPKRLKGSQMQMGARIETSGALVSGPSPEAAEAGEGWG